MLSYYLSLLEVGLLLIAIILLNKKKIKAVFFILPPLFIFPVLSIYTSVTTSAAIVLAASLLLGFLFPARDKEETNMLFSLNKKKAPRNEEAALVDRQKPKLRSTQPVPTSAFLKPGPPAAPAPPSLTAPSSLTAQPSLTAPSSLAAPSSLTAPSSLAAPSSITAAHSPTAPPASYADAQAPPNLSVSPLAQSIIDEFNRGASHEAPMGFQPAGPPDINLTPFLGSAPNMEAFSNPLNAGPAAFSPFDAETADLGSQTAMMQSLAAEMNFQGMGGAQPAPETSYTPDEGLFGLKQPDPAAFFDGGTPSGLPDTAFGQPENHVPENTPQTGEQPGTAFDYLRNYGVHFDNNLTMSEFLTDRRSPGTLFEIASVIRVSSETAVHEIESLLREICLSSADPFVSNKALYAVQCVRNSRGLGEDRQLIKAMIAKEEKILNETSDGKLVSNY